ncbi:MAG: hypothetical protein ACK559_22905 [bacterium]
MAVGRVLDAGPPIACGAAGVHGLQAEARDDDDLRLRHGGILRPRRRPLSGEQTGEGRAADRQTGRRR